MEDIGITSLSEVRAREEATGEGREGEKRQKIEEEREGGGGGGGGLLDNLLAKLSSPRATASDHPIDDGHDLEAADAAHLHASTNGKSEDRVESDVDGDDNTAAAGGGGVINNIISSIFHRGGGVDEGENGKHGGDRGKIQNKVEEASEVGDNKDLAQQNGGIKTNGGSIVSNLLSDDVAPASDEASILIHSVVHD